MIKTTTRFILGLMVLMTTALASAQSPAHVPGDILVRPNSVDDIKDLLTYKLRVGNELVDFELKEVISDRLRIYLLSYDHTQVNEDHVLRELRNDRRVDVAQFNHYVETRETLPDDPLIGEQWQYVNDGSNGGTVDGDIDMDEAWDITTGGLTANGDEIVVCVIDDGIDNNHPDIEPNLWVNEAEIPNNGLDDDNNGFIDDYRGWDTGANSDAVYDGGGHGTPVAGIVGAKGNNGTGVSGVNWDVKLMIVQGGTGVESEVLEAYSYPYTMRQMYNESNGAEGAFVVSTNASWGINFGQPANAPLWCDFYDTLGEEGILSCGATINGNQNVDEVGDLPTACPSEYLISVTNMNRQDVKVTGAGYGAETIDLGAHGQDAFNVQAGGGYGGFGGTSGATPHVAGAIGLLYSVPCSGLISLAQADPQAAAEQVRDAILNGVDPNESLEGITTTGGRMNVFTSLGLILESCGPCPAPFGIEFTDLVDVEGTLTWTQDESAIQVNLEYRPAGGDWTVVEDVTAPYTIAGLTACSDYELRMISTCDTMMSDYGPIFPFSTDGCCENPDDFQFNSADNDSGLFTWSPIFAATQYNVRFRELGATDWTESNATDTFFYAEPLDPCTEYEIQLQVVCAGETVAYSTSIEFITFGCGACTDFEYCEMPEVSVADEWIGNVSVGDIDHDSSTDGDNSYQDFTADGPTTVLHQSSTYAISLAPEYSGTEYSEYFLAYIDYNQDGEFDEEDEVIFDSGEAAIGPVSGSFEVPSDALLGYTRMRIVMAYNGPGNSCDFDSNYGEAEDYCVTIDIPSSLEELGALSAWMIMPNPAENQVSVQVSDIAFEANMTLELIDLQGRLLQVEPMRSSRIDIDLSTVDAGVYLLRMTDAAGHSVSKQLIVK